MVEQYQVFKIPLNKSWTYGYSPAFPPYVESGATIPDHIVLGRARLPDAGAIGFLKDGVPIYPSFDNADYALWEVCEGDVCNAHSGRGADYHYHGDPFGDPCVYSHKDYGSNSSHPPFIGFSADGMNLGEMICLISTDTPSKSSVKYLTCCLNLVFKQSYYSPIIFLL